MFLQALGIGSMYDTEDKDNVTIDNISGKTIM